MDDEVELVVRNYPASGEDTFLYGIVFGPESENFALLVEVEPTTGRLSVTIGNGPDTTLVPEVVPAILREVADILELLEVE